MTRFFRMGIGAILLALVFTTGIACAADGDQKQADLNISKIVSSTGPYETDDKVTWVVTLWNNGPGKATNISVAENITGLAGLNDITATASPGTYDTATNLWNISELENATSATLTLTTNFSSFGDKINKVAITALDENDPFPSDNSAQATVQIRQKEIPPSQGPKADLAISKRVSSTGPYNLEDNVTWVVTLRNHGPGNATNITVTEDISDLTGLNKLTATASLGNYDTATNLWTIPELEKATSATLTLNTNFSSSGKKINKVAITACDEMDPDGDNNAANATVKFNISEIVPPVTPVSAKLVIRPTTLNLKSNGVFTVYVTLADLAGKPATGDTGKPRVDFSNSILTCSGADWINWGVSNKDGGTLIAKFYRQDLLNVTKGNGVQVNCSGTLSANGETFDINGSGTIRVIGEKRGADKIFSQVLQLLGLEKAEEEISDGDELNVTPVVLVNPEEIKNPGQVKKALKANDNETGTAPGNVTVESDDAPEVKEKGNSQKNNENPKQIKGNAANPNSGNSNASSNERDDDPAGKATGKKDK